MRSDGCLGSLGFDPVQLVVNLLQIAFHFQTFIAIGFLLHTFYQNLLTLQNVRDPRRKYRGERCALLRGRPEASG